MRYPLALETDSHGGYSVMIPDVPGCFSAGDTIDEAIEMAAEAINGHLQILFEEGEPIPTATTMDTHVHHEDYAACTWAYVDIDIAPYMGKTEKANVTLPVNLVKRIDAVVAAGAVKSRSAFLTESALQRLNRLTPHMLEGSSKNALYFAMVASTPCSKPHG